MVGMAFPSFAANVSGTGAGGSSSVTSYTINISQVAPMIDSLPYQSISATEEKDLEYMRQEEKLARDVYLTLYNKWGLNIFNNIADSESTHTEMIRLILQKYNLPDPVEETGDEIGVFKDPVLTNLYNQLVEEGEKSLVDALKVGATIEDLDISDLQKALSETDNEDIAFVYENLMKGSRNHLRSFVRTLERYGATYTPQYISQQEYESIINSPMEQGIVQPNPSVACPKTPFSDVSSSDWYCPYVTQLKQQGIISGYPNGTFNPNGYITRGEIAKMIVLADNVTPPQQCATDPFTDVDITSWYCRYVEAAKQAGLVHGFSDGTYKPNEDITRADLAIIIARMDNLTIEQCTERPFIDVPIDYYACPYIQALKNDNLTTGYPDGTFRPDSPVKRAEAAAMIYRAMEFKRKMAQNQLTPPDNSTVSSQ